MSVKCESLNVNEFKWWTLENRLIQTTLGLSIGRGSKNRVQKEVQSKVSSWKNNFPSQSWNDTLSENRFVQSVLGSSIERGSEIALKRRSVESELSKNNFRAKGEMINFQKIGSFRPYWGLVSRQGSKIALKGRSVKHELSTKKFQKAKSKLKSN